MVVRDKKSLRDTMKECGSEGVRGNSIWCQYIMVSFFKPLGEELVVWDIKFSLPYL